MDVSGISPWEMEHSSSVSTEKYLSSKIYTSPMDVAIVGGGPVGLFIAASLSRMGYSVTVFEEHSDIGNPSHCSGLFSGHILEIVGGKERRGVLKATSKAEIVAPDGSSLQIQSTTTKVYVVNRVEFDRSLARDAINKGAEIRLKERVRAVSKGFIKTSRGEYQSRIIVGAGGINSVVRREIMVSAPRIIGAAQVIADYHYEDEDLVRIYVGNKIAPGFFAWIIPLGDDVAKIGLASYGNSWLFLKRLLKRLNAQPLSVSGGGIPVSTVSKTYGNGMLIVGDAAGQVKATSGGGVYPGLKSAQCAVRTIEIALESGDYSRAAMKKYEDCWRREIGKELSNAQYIHRQYRKIKDVDFNNIVRELNRPDMLKIINEYGDIDYPSKVVWKLLKKNPRLIKYTRIIARK